MLHLFIVTRWGNGQDSEGSDGEDTHFLVKALGVEQAAEIVDEYLKRVPHQLVADFCQRITQIGNSLSSDNSSVIILGPVISESLAHDDSGIQNKDRWVRDSVEDGWINFEDYYE